MIWAVILAAGQSRRMGVQKLLLPFGGSRQSRSTEVGSPGRTAIGHIVGEVLRSPVDQTLVVVGRDAARVASALAGLGVTFATNPDPDGDMLSSVRCGLRALPADCRGVLVALGDQPSITSDLVGRMLDAFGTGDRGIVVPVYGGRRGHPILFSASYGPEILTGFDSVGLRGLLGAHGPDVLELPVTSPCVLSDMDYPEDYRREMGESD
jgi:molybdenum cofactor cytidylyltransferase